MTDPDRPDPPRDIARIVPDTTALKALAHPERLRMLGLLRVDGPATATGLARRLGLNSGATSYHLRQLAAHGFVEQATELGNKRERWWRARHDSTVFDPSDGPGDAVEAGLAMTQAVISQHMQLLQRALGEFRDLPGPWRKATSANDIVVPVTADEAHDLVRRLTSTLNEAQAAHPGRAAPLPDGMRNFMVILHGFPFPDLASGAGEDEG